MGKYTPLEKHLANKGNHHIPMSFSDIESIIKDELPPSARKHRAWWSNNASNSVITNAWLNAGYKTADVDLARERLVFLRLNAVEEEKPKNMTPRRHPVFGCMKGTVTLAEGVDLTDPAFPEWPDLIDQAYPMK